MYYTLFNMLHDYIYGFGTTLTEHMELTLTILATIGSIFVTALPFLVVWRVLKSVVMR